MKPKTILYILIALAIVAVAAFIIYQLVYSGNGGNSNATGQTGSLPAVTSQQFPSSGQASTVGTFNTNETNSSSSKFGIISNDPALNYFVDAANTVTLVKPDGTIESITNNKASVLSSSVVSNIINTAFSYDGKKIFITYQVGTTTQSSVFDLASRSWAHLPNGILSPAWSPVNYQIAYLVPINSGSETLTTIDAGTVNAKPAAVATLALEDMLLQWPNKNTVVLSDRPSAFTEGSVWLFDLPSKTLSSAAYENLGTESIWDASGSALIFSANSNNAGGQLAFRDASGAQKTLSFTTLPSKCTFATSLNASGTTNSSPLIYCAIPSDTNTFSVARLPDEYDQDIYFTNDNFYRIDTGAGSLNQIFSFSDANQNIDATHLKVFNNILFFVNRYDQKIYALAL